MTEETPTYNTYNMGIVRTPDEVKVNYVPSLEGPQVFGWDFMGRHYTVEVFPKGRYIVQTTDLKTGQTWYEFHKIQGRRIMGYQGRVTVYGSGGGEDCDLPGAPSALAYVLSRGWIDE